MFKIAAESDSWQKDQIHVQCQLAHNFFAITQAGELRVDEPLVV
jgi:hypothetical protein